MTAAIDFGISNTDAVARVDGVVRRWSRATAGLPSHDSVREILAAGGVDLAGLESLAVTGGQHRTLPVLLGATSVVGVPEIAAIGRGGQALAIPDGEDPSTPILVVSAGSGTAVIAARGDQYVHVTGSGVGGGSLLGLGRLLLGTTDARAIDAMAWRGDANGADLALRDVVCGPIGALPPDATAVNFGRLARQETPAHPDDLAAALMTLVGQVIAITAINAARAQQIDRIVVIGHMADMPSFRRVITLVGKYYDTELLQPEHAGFGTALGAMLHVAGAPLDGRTRPS